MKKIKLIFNKPDFNSLSLLSGNMAMLHKEGISLLIMIDLIMELPLRKSYRESMKNIKDFIVEGKSLNESFNEFNDLYPEFFVGMVSMGEKSGNLSEVLKGLEEYYDKISFIKSTIKNVLSYPILLFLSIITVFIFIAFVTIPSLYDFYLNLNIEIPSVCKFLYNIVNYIKTNPIYSLIYFLSWGILLPYIIYRFYLKEYIKVLFNKIKIIREFNEFVFISLLSIIIRSGVNLSNGLMYSATSFKNSNLKEKFILLNSSILKGETISESLKKQGNYSNYTISIIKLGEEGGAMDERLKSLSTHLEKKLLSDINRYMAILQPASILIMGAFVIIFLMIFIVPLFSSLLDGGL
ncbi:MULTISPECIES: type II secretion system F family protein [Clostridium]|uniref:type II secretion system F family protein n=1 Tax=Clostridium TaxID=1485 RepID=UPI001896FE8D|nr:MULTISPECIES: type II secretion system F family protein [Clostridium]MDI9216124.1 type II secretion system F family protein [Clostridium tertium]